MRIFISLCVVLIVTTFAYAAPAPNMSEAVEIDGPYDVTMQINSRGPAQTLLLDWSGKEGLAVTFDQKSLTVVEVTAKGTRTIATRASFPTGQVRIKRRFPLLEIHSGAPLYLRTYSRRKLAGIAAPATSAKFDDFALQPVEPIDFRDDFFDPSGAESLWEPVSGNWSIGTYRDPLKAIENRPIAASWYQCDDAGRAVSLTGQDFWDNYRVRVAVRASDKVESGLVFCATSKDSYRHRFAVKPQPNGQGSLSGSRTGPTFPWRPGNWYELAVEVCGDRATGFVQGQPVVTYTLQGSCGGKAGLYALGRLWKEDGEGDRLTGEARFDDFAVSSIRRVEMQPDWRQECWQTLSGKWEMVKFGALGSGTPPSVIQHVMDYEPNMVSAVVVPQKGATGIVLNWRGQSGYCLNMLGDAKYRLSRVTDGKETTLATGDVPRAESYRVRLSHSTGRLEAQVGEVRQVVYDFSYDGGAAGCCVGGSGLFRSFSAGIESDEATLISTLTGAPTPMPGENSDSRRMVLGYIWQPSGGNWIGTGPADDKLLSGRPYGQSPASLWYYQPCPGDAVMSLTELKLPDSARAGLAIGCEKRDVMAGYRAELQGLSLKLFRQDKQLAETTLTQPADGLRLWRDGNFIVAQVGAQAVSFNDPQALPGSLCAAYAVGSGATVREITLAHRRASYYTFKSEETDWQPVQGEWLTHSGMACIPWDYWYTARAEPQALAFHAQPRLDLQHLDVWVSEYSEGYETLEHKHFPYHDISLVMNADKPELDAGYRFLIATEGGGVTRLLRQGQVVAETRDPAVAIRMGGHCSAPRDVHVVFHREGGRLTLHLNDRLALDWTDPQPLAAGMVGIGTTGCIANFRDLWFVRQAEHHRPAGDL